MTTPRRTSKNVSIPRPKKRPRHTPAEIGRLRIPCPPMGDYLWRQTAQVQPPSPVAEISGRLRQECVFYTRGGKVFVRPYVSPADPETGFQMDQRARFLAGKRHWGVLSEAEREGWRRYAAAQWRPDQDESPDVLGPNLYTGAQIQRLAWGASLRTAPPSQPPPAAVVEIRQAAAPPGMFAFEVMHGQGQIAGCRLLLEMTPEMPTLKRTPREGELRRAAATDAGSFFPLAPSGAVYLLDAPRFAVAPGRRYGVRVRLLTDDGVAGPQLRADFLRLEADPGGAMAEAGEAGEAGGAGGGDPGTVDSGTDDPGIGDSGAVNLEADDSGSEDSVGNDPGAARVSHQAYLQHLAEDSSGPNGAGERANAGLLVTLASSCQKGA